MQMRMARVAALTASALLLLACGGGSNKAASSTTSSSSSTRSSSSSSSSDVAAPQGFLVIKAPDGIDPNLFGQNVAVTTTKLGAPIVAFAVHDASGDRSTIEVATYNDTTKAFGQPVTVATASLYDEKQSISIALDQASGTEVLTWDDSGKIIASQSTDDGGSWHTTTVADGSDLSKTGRTPAIAAKNGKVAITYTDGNDIPAVATGDLTTTAFTLTEVPNPGDPAVSNAPPAIEPAADGTFAIA